MIPELRWSAKGHADDVVATAAHGRGEIRERVPAKLWNDPEHRKIW